MDRAFLFITVLQVLVEVVNRVVIVGKTKVNIRLNVGESLQNFNYLIVTALHLLIFLGRYGEALSSSEKIAWFLVER